MSQYNKTEIGDCLEILRKWAGDGVQVHTCVTSPPYFGLRDYGHEGQIGMEETPEAYVAALVEVFRAVRKVLRDDGTLWLNLGDSYNAHPGQRKVTDKVGLKQQTNRGSPGVPSRYVPSLKPKDLIGIPWRVAFALQADGWYLRQDIIWSKPNPMPESVTDRCTKSHEYIFLLSKSPKYYYDHEAIKEPALYGSRGSEFHTGKTLDHQLGRASKKRGDFNGKTNAMPGRESFRAITEKRNKRSVWAVSSKPYAGAHFACFPPELITPCILAGCPEGGIVLDPFMGSGTTGYVAKQLDRQHLGCELNPEYIVLQEERMDSLGRLF